MDRLRRWPLDPSRPSSLLLAADSRLRPTDYTDDQVWRLSVGTGESPALALQTTYGGRVGLASLIPLWVHDGRMIYETLAYARPPVLTGFAPGYLRLQATLTPQLALQAEYWAIDSHTIGGQFTISNARSALVHIRFDLFGHVGAQGKEQPLGIVPLSDGTHALQLGKVGNINPAALVEDGKADIVSGQPTIPKIGRAFEIGGRKKVTFRWVHAGLPTVAESIAQAQHWLAQDWKPYFRQIHLAANFIPDIETGDLDLDATIATAFHQVLLAYLKPTSSLPYASIVAQREPGTGFSRRTDGADYPRAWNGQPPTLSYLAALATASIDPALAQGLVRNYLAVQQDDGWIDWKPGLGGQRQGIMCLPLLARLAWGIFQYTEDGDFLREVYPGLRQFFERWLAFDVDGDGLPEWQHELQTGYGYWPTFGGVQPWAENTDIRTIETPGLLAYLLSEAVSLQAIAHYLRDAEGESQVGQHIQRLQDALASLWNGRYYAYRDRDTHQTTPRQTLLENGRGDREHILAQKLDPPNRINIRVEGGVDHTPRFRLEVRGLDQTGKAIEERIDQTAFLWQHNRGVYTTERVFSQVDLVHFDGLSRVYSVNIYTPDTTRLDINALLPLWSVALPPERSAELIKLLTDEFLRPNGVTMAAASDPRFDPANAEGSGGVWPFWLTLIGEGLIEMGRFDLAADLLQRLLRVQVETLRQHKHFSEFYHSDEPAGLGTPGHLAGSVPVYLL
ncbi:MAG TPA: GH116 family glycosyl hydrolase, partial [Spirillospora sp.]|nr:GH116 family glycosyl hydrolase [Spirillospora sp.]